MPLAIPEDLQQLIKEHGEVKWSEIARRAMWEHARKLELLDALAKDSTLTEKDVSEIGALVKAGLRKRYAPHH